MINFSGDILPKPNTATAPSVPKAPAARRLRFVLGTSIFRNSCAQAANLVEQAARIRDRKISQENRRKDLLFQQANEQLNKCDKLSSLNDKVWAGRGNLFLNGNDEMLFGGEASKTDVRMTTNSLEVSV